MAARFLVASEERTSLVSFVRCPCDAFWLALRAVRLTGGCTLQHEAVCLTCLAIHLPNVQVALATNILHVSLTCLAIHLH